MAVMTYKELKKRGLNHGVVWFGYLGVLEYFMPDGTYLIKGDFGNGSSEYLSILDCYELSDDLTMTKVCCDIAGIKFRDRQNNIVFAKNSKELIKYCKNMPIRVPRYKDVGTLAYKLLRVNQWEWDEVQNEYAMCVLEIPPEARCTSPYFGTKCRADMAKVRGIWKLNWDGSLGEKLILAYSPFIEGADAMCYVLGMTMISEYNPSRLVECTRGIHFYMTKEEVLNVYK